MKPKIPSSPFTTHLSGSAKEVELRLRSIFQWKKKRPPALLVMLTALAVLLCCGLVSCRVREEPNAPEDTAQDSPAVSPALPAETLAEQEAPAEITPVPPEEWRKTAEGAAALDAYRAVLQGEATYFNTFAGENLTICQPSSQAGSVTIKVTRFAVLDLDRDGIPEVVLWLNYDGNDYIGFQILRVQDGAVYGYNLVYRAFEELKADGTFSFSSGAFDHGWGTITFAGDSYSVDQVSYCASSYDFDTHQYLSERYVVDREDASAEEFEAAITRQHAKPDAPWQDFTEDNINAVFSGGEGPRKEAGATPGEQVRLIAELADTWAVGAAYANELYGYAVTDLDGNGRLELIAAHYGGTGHYTYARFYEVNDACTALVPCPYAAEEGESQADLLFGPEAAYYSSAAGITYYIFKDSGKLGAAEYPETTLALWLDSGKVQALPLAAKYAAHKGDGTLDDLSVTDWTGAEIGEAEYAAIGDRYFAGQQKLSAAFGWLEMPPEDVKNTDSETLAALLLDSYRGFSVREAP